jgi:hypothetical protein
MPLYFVTEVEITRDRWYWSDKKISTVARHFRLAYQPLTRLWRLNVSREPIGSVGLASSLSQNFETFLEALAANSANRQLAIGRFVKNIDSDHKSRCCSSSAWMCRSWPGPFR